MQVFIYVFYSCKLPDNVTHEIRKSEAGERNSLIPSKVLRRKGAVHDFVFFCIDFSEAVSGLPTKRICPKACFCDLSLFVHVQSSDGSLAKIVKFFLHYYTISNWSGLLLAPCDPYWGSIPLSQCRISDLMLFLCQCVTWVFLLSFPETEFCSGTVCLLSNFVLCGIFEFLKFFIVNSQIFFFLR